MMFTFSLHALDRDTQERVQRKSSSSSMSSPSLFSSSSAGEEVSELGASRGSASVVTALSNTSAPPKVELKCVWDFEKIEKHGGSDIQSRSWSCGWCGLKLKGWNATKALVHVTKTKGNNDVKACTGKIPPETLTLFQTFRQNTLRTATVKRAHKDAFAENVSMNQKSISVMFEESRSRSSKSASSIVSNAAGNAVHVLDGHQDVSVSNSARLTAAIAEFVYSKGLSFSAVDGDEFRQVLKLSRLVSTSYCPPTRKVLANELLQVSYDNRIQTYLKNLDIDAEVYGLSLFGDGATVHGMPLMNVLASGVTEPCAVLAIVECKLLVGCCLVFFFNLTHNSLLSLL